VDSSDAIYTTKVIDQVLILRMAIDDKGISILTKHAFKTENILERREAQRCLANALFLKPLTRKIFADVGVNEFIKAFKLSAVKGQADDDFLLGRIGFLLTADKGEVVERLVNKKEILGDVEKVIFIHLCSSH